MFCIQVSSQRPAPPAARSFWGQLVLTVVSTTILLFSTGVPLGAAATSGSVVAVRAEMSFLTWNRCLVVPVPLRLGASEHALPLSLSNASLLLLPSCLPPSMQLTFIDVATLFGILCGYISTFLAWSYTRAGRKLALLQVWLRAASELGCA